MGIWTSIEELKTDIAGNKREILSEYQALKGDVFSIGSQLTGKCREITIEATGKIKPFIGELDAFTDEINSRCENMLVEIQQKVAQTAAEKNADSQQVRKKGDSLKQNVVA